LCLVKRPTRSGNDGTTPTTYLVTTTFYDKEYSIIQVNKQNHLDGSDIASNAYDFANRLIKSRRDHTAVVSGGSKSYITREEYVYDHASRLRFTRHKINTANWVVTSAPVYDEMGRLLDKRLHASNYDGVSAVTTASTFNYLQSLDYTYNIRNWLTGINDPTTCTLQSGDQLQDVFRMQLNYETSVNGSTAQYNGNISSIQWNTHLNGTCSQRQLYMFSYDAGNRLTAAAHRSWNGTAWTDPNQYNESGISYDLNGNLKTYTRRGLTEPSTFGDIDILSYTYGDAQRPDRLTKITDTGDANKGFKHNPPATGNHYAYDGVGNMTTDNHKKITIAYNYLNLPSVITYTDGTNRKIEWTYDANGTKLTKVTSTNGVVNATKNYATGIEYAGSNLEAILYAKAIGFVHSDLSNRDNLHKTCCVGVYFAEGRLTPNGASFYYEYTVKDHLGNARISFRANGTAISILQENHYYPFGLEMEGSWQAQVGAENAYQYNSKELNEDFGLNWYDYGARWYDAAVGRWWSVDPLGEKSKSLSTYTYVRNNPLVMIDPTGMDSEAYSFVKSYTSEDMQEKSKSSGGSQGDPEKLKQAAKNAVAAVVQSDDGIHKPARCNVGVSHAFLELTGSDALSGMRANQMVEYMTNSDNFEKIDMEDSQEAANNGEIVIAGWINPDPEESGHVAMVVPGNADLEGTWNKMKVSTMEGGVPNVMDTGVNKREESQSIRYSFGKGKQADVGFFKYVGGVNENASINIQTLRLPQVTVSGTRPVHMVKYQAMDSH
jgi:RHS repeat-associated protein